MKPKLEGSAATLLLLTFAGWLSGDQRRVVEYLREENRVLRDMLGSKPLRFTDTQRRRLAIKAKGYSRRTLGELGPLVTPDTLVCCRSPASA